MGQVENHVRRWIQTYYLLQHDQHPHDFQGQDHLCGKLTLCRISSRLLWLPQESPSATQGGTEKGDGTTAGRYVKGDPSGFTLPRRTRYAKRRVSHEPHVYVSQLNNPTLALGSNFGGQNGDSTYPISYRYGRHNAGVGQMFDTGDFVNHNLDGRSNDYVPRAVPDPSTIGGLHPSTLTEQETF